MDSQTQTIIASTKFLDKLHEYQLHIEHGHQLNRVDETKPRLSTWFIFTTFFKVTCYVSTIYTICYWIDAFAIKDEDLSVVEYESVQKTQHNEIPMVSVCFFNPFLDSRLKGINPNISATLYGQYLRGHTFDERFTNIDYDNVTYQLSDEYLYGLVVWTNRSVSYNVRSLIKRSIHETFSGFYGFSPFMKCFGVQFDDNHYKDIRYLFLFFKGDKFFSNPQTKHWHRPMVIIHYPKQILLSKHLKKTISIQRKNNTGVVVNVKLIQAEIVQERNKPKAKCLPDERHYDDIMLKRHIERHGCRPPYIMSYNQSNICSTEQKIKESRYDIDGFNNFEGEKQTLVPCRRMINADYEIEVYENQTPDFDPDLVPLQFLIWFPYQSKIITQTKAVNGQTFISNVGGYIGLFLGKLTE